MARTQPITARFTSTPAATHLDYLDHFAGIDEVPEADSPEDIDEGITTRPVNLDGDGVAYIEHIEGRVEMTVKMRGRLQVALILSPDEAEEVGLALARPHGPTVGDVFDMHDRLGCCGGKR